MHSGVGDRDQYTGKEIIIYNAQPLQKERHLGDFREEGKNRPSWFRKFVSHQHLQMCFQGWSKSGSRLSLIKENVFLPSLRLYKAAHSHHSLRSTFLCSFTVQLQCPSLSFLCARRAEARPSFPLTHLSSFHSLLKNFGSQSSLGLLDRLRAAPQERKELDV